jgi:hypothetical protein
LNSKYSELLSKNRVKDFSKPDFLFFDQNFLGREGKVSPTRISASFGTFPSES